MNLAIRRQDSFETSAARLVVNHPVFARGVDASKYSVSGSGSGSG